LISLPLPLLPSAIDQCSGKLPLLLFLFIHLTYLVSTLWFVFLAYSLFYNLSIRGSSASSSPFSLFPFLKSSSTSSLLPSSTASTSSSSSSSVYGTQNSIGAKNVLPRKAMSPEEEEEVWQRNKKSENTHMLFYCYIVCWGIPAIELFIQIIFPPKCSNLPKPNMNLFHVMSKFYLLALFISLGISYYFFYLNIAKAKQVMKLLDIGTSRGSIDKMSIRPTLVYLALFLIANFIQFPAFLFCFFPNFGWKTAIHFVQILVLTQGFLFSVWFIYKFKLLQTWEKKIWNKDDADTPMVETLATLL